MIDLIKGKQNQTYPRLIILTKQEDCTCCMDFYLVPEQKPLDMPFRFRA